MSVTKFPNFNNLLEERILSGSYSYVTATNSISGKYLDEFVKGIIGYCNSFEFLLNERGYSHHDLQNESLAERLIQEDVKKLNLEDDYLSDFESVEDGKREISIFEYVENINLFVKVLGGLNGVKSLSKQSLKEIILDSPSRAIYLRNKIDEEQIDPEINEYCKFIAFTSKSQAISAGLELGSMTQVVALFEECQALQSGNKTNMDMIIWELFGNNSEIFIDDLSEGIDYAAHRLLRIPTLVNAERRENSLRSFYDQIRIYGTQDAFKQFVAKKLKIYNEEKSSVILKGGFELTCFENQYKNLDKKIQESIDKEVIVQLNRFKLRNQKFADTPIIQVTPPFDIKYDTIKKYHTLVYNF